jgi:flagellin
LSGTDQELLTFTSGTNTVNVTLNVGNANNVSNALATLNNSLAGLGISAVLDTNGTGVAFQSANAFSVTKAVNTVANGGQTGVFAATTGAGFTDNSVAPTITAGVTSNALSAITAVNSAIAHLGNVQGAVGAGENKLNYAIGLATSQITSFSAAQSRIRDADMAAEAANLTKAQILQQSSVAAMAQANSAPQAVLALLK